MKVPLHWLHEYVRPDLDPAALAERLAMTGTEVDRIHHHGVDNLGSFVVGKVLDAVQHPDADRLRVCTVDVGDGEPSQIVCGAPNVAAGQTVAVAKPGAIMPDGTRLKAAKLRGVVSAGMICAEDELGLGTEHDGILVLDDHLRAGEPLAEALPIADEVLELEITPNRPDCLGVFGIAREVHAATGAPLAAPPWAHDPGAGPGAPPAELIAVDVQAPDLCPRFVARAFEDVTIAPSPRWLKARLMAAGQRPINNVVDITNYVMLLTGQPVHAFDLDRVAGGRLTVRRGIPGERMHTLDDVERVLDEDTCVIADADGPTSIAGIMGGRRSEVEPGTARVLMEAASWNGPNVNRTMARMNLRSEAGARFEKGLAPEQAMEAQAVATALMLELTGARLVAGTVDEGGPGPAPATLRLRDARVAGLLGIEVPRAEARRALEALDFGVADAPDGLDVTVPAFRRNDVTREADLIEEVARLDVLERLPATLPRNRLNRAGRLSREQVLRRRAEDVLVGQGLREVAGWSFAPRSLLDRLRIPEDSPVRDVIELQNPMSEAQAILRPTILGSLLDVAAHNVAHGMSDLALFESAAVYRRRAPDDLSDDPRAAPADEHHALAVLLHGAPAPRAWTGEGTPPADLFAAKAVLEAVLAVLRVEVSYAPAQWPFLHPGRAAEVLAADGRRLGFVGEVHPLVAERWELPHTAAAWAIDLGAVIARAPGVPRYRDLTSYPALTQDLAVVVAEDVPAARVLEVVRAAGGARLADVSVFDVYRGAQLGEGRRSLALHCTFRAPDRTLTDEDVAPLREKIVARLAGVLGGELRGDAGALAPAGGARAKVLVAGASGYAGALAARLVAGHPRMDLVHVTSRSDAGRRLDDLYPHHRVPLELAELDVGAMASGVDAAIVAYPHGAAAPTVAALRAHGVKVVDLSADLRLRDVATYEEWYVPHPEPGLVPDAVYGLPERYRPYLRGADLVAGPGCFPTAAVLALAPLAPWIEDVVIDAKTGVSGAGRAASDRTHFVAVDENVSAYGVGHHRHTPEIDQELEAAGAQDLRVTFVPHLLPLDQGELVSCYVTLRAEADVDPALAFTEAYAEEPFVELAERPPGVRDVRETNMCRIHVAEDPRTGKVLVFAAIDNLWKGTSSQAIQSLNLMLGFDETDGLR